MFSSVDLGRVGRMCARSTAALRIALLNASVLLVVLCCSCGFDRSKQAEANRNTGNQRAVYGDPNAASVSPSSQPKPSVEAASPEAVDRQAEADGTTRARVEANEDETEPAPPPATGEQTTASVGDPGTLGSRVRGRAVGPSGNSPAGSQANDRGTNAVGGTSSPRASYQPKGTVVGDPGERSAIAAGRVAANVPSSIFPRLIRRWADTLASGNLGGHMALYGSRLSRFDGAVNVSREIVRQRKQETLARLQMARNLQLLDLRVIHPSGSELASATFTTEWTEGGRKRSQRYRLTFRRMDGDWLIHSEERL